MADNLLVLNAANVTYSIRGVDLGTGTSLIMMSTPGTVGGTTVLTQSAATAGSWAMPVVMSPNGINANGIATAGGSAPTVLAQDQPSQAVALDVNVLANANSTTLLTVNFTAFSMNTNSTATLVAAVSSKKIRVVNFWAITNTATTFQLLSAAATISGPMAFAANAGIVLPSSNLGWLETASGSALVGSSSASATVGGNIAYVTI